MEINLNSNVGPVPKPTGPRPTARPANAEFVAAEFSQTAALESALRVTPEVRPEVVARAKRLIADVQYPPAETIRQLASLLAMHVRKD